MGDRADRNAERTKEWYDAEFERVSSFVKGQAAWSRVILANLWYATQERPSSANRLLRDSLGRGIRQLETIERLARDRAVADASILLRTLTDRFLLLNHLHEHDEFDLFEEWSELQRLRHRQRLLDLRLAAPDVDIEPDV